MSKIRIIFSKLWEIIKSAFAFVGKAYRWMRTDGLLHCFVSAILYLILAPFNPVGAAAITIIVGMIKEAYDEEHGGSCEWHDIYCDLLGIALGILIYLEYMIV